MSSEIALNYPASPRYRWLLFSGVLALLGLAYWTFPAFRETAQRVISPMAMGDVRALKEFILSFGWWAPAVSAFLMILQTLIAPLPAFVLAIANAMVFGLFWGCLLTCGSALVAALIAFHLSRWLGRPFVQRWRRARPMDALFERYGAWGILVLRLFPIVSFDFVSFAAGVTAIRAKHFALATFVGMLPAAIAYSLLGESIESASRWSLAGGAVILTALLAGTFIFKKSGAWRNLKFTLPASDEKVIEG
jgi:uncharacterized membrane protein YdjX (TVP38/TMEM64 family)